MFRGIRGSGVPTLALCLALCFGLFVNDVGLAQEEFEGLTIQEVRFEGLKRVPPESLEFYLGIQAGDTLSLSRLNDGIENLWSYRLIDDIQVEAEPLEGGVVLLIRVKERPVLGQVEYEGLKRLSQADIDDRAAAERIRVREGVEMDLGEVERLRALIESLYREKGFRFAQASYELRDGGGTDQDVLFTIDEGDKVRIADIDFEGNTVFGDRRLQLIMRRTKESGLLSRMLKKDVFNPATLEEDLESVYGLYQKSGYKNITLGEPQIEVEALRPGAADVADQKRRLFITVPVEEGSRWKLGDISIDGNDTFSDELLLRVFRRPPKGWLRQNVIDEGLEAVRNAYSNSGYLFARVESEYREKEERTADLLLHINEGEQFKLGRLEFEGNTRTNDKVLRREIRVREGNIFNSTALQNSLRRVQQLQYFTLDETNPVEFENFDTENQTVDVTINGAEGDRTELQFGAGWSEIDEFFGQFSFRTRNFLGRGETLGVSVQTGRLRELYDISYFIPWFLDRPQSIGFQGFRRDTDFSLVLGQEFVQSTRGGSFSYGRNFRFFQSASMQYSYSEILDRRTLQNEFGELITQQFDRSVAILRPSYTFDSRDSVLAPTAGKRISASVEYAGGFLGGNTNYVRPQVDVTMFFPVTKAPLRTVFGINIEAGMIEPFGGVDLFPLDRYFIGGEQSVRGFRARSIWARDAEGNTLFDETGFILGGDRFFQANLEYHFVLRGPVRVLIFGDAGNVFTDDQGFDLGMLRYSAGVELRVTVPVFGAPLRFIYATNLDPLPDDRFENFQFSIGTTF